jgi:NADH:ubiquinone oxidoreductase subunit K
MAGIFDAIPTISVILFVIGIVGVMVYEKSRSKTVEESNS